MPVDLAALVAPEHTAVVSNEIQNGVIGPGSALPELAEAASRALPQIAALADAARRRGMAVVHATAVRRADALGANRNARLFQYMAKAETPLTPGTAAAAIVDAVPVHPTDLVMERLHGLSPFHGTELDFVLRNQGVRTIVAVGVSVNVAIQNLAFDAVNAAYQVVIPRDAVAGFPADYVDAVFANTLGAITTLVSTKQILDAWDA